MNISAKIGNHIIKVKKEEQFLCVGLNSNLIENANTDRWFEHHFLMIDYDDKLSLQNLIIETKRLQGKFLLPNAYIFESSFNHYIVYYFGVDMDYFDCLKVIHDTPCDEEYKKFRMIRQSMTLRITEKGSKHKPTFVCAVKNPEVDFFDFESDNEYIQAEQKKIMDSMLKDVPIVWEGKVNDK